MMKHYFILQSQLIHRHLLASGLPIGIAYLLIPVGFLGGSILVFEKTELAPIVYPVLCLTLLMPFSNQRRNEFLQISFGDRRQQLIRIIENLIITVPFVIFLLYQLQWLSTIALIGASIGLAVWQKKYVWRFSLPTPFARHQFEFNAAFRHSFILLISIMAIHVIAITVENFNLGIAALLFIFVIMMPHLSHPEPEYYVWNYASTPRLFLLQKSKMVVINAIILSSPIWASLIIFFPDQILLIITFEAIGIAVLIATLMSKYAAFPYEMSIAQGIALALVISFPPALLVYIPYTYHLSKKRLSNLLR
jgi:hypothetical protein